MFRLFQKERSELLTERMNYKYVRYAIGELILVVFGILIALQINNWNEERIEQRQITEYAHALIKDLERDLAMAEIIKTEINLLIEKIDTLASYVKNKSLDQMSNIDLFYLMHKPFYRPFSWNRSAMDQIKNSGALRQMKNKQLMQKISAYESLTHHLDGDFDFDRTIGTNSLALASRVVDMNYLNLHEIFPVGSVGSFSFPNSNLREAYKNTNRSLLTNNIKDLEVAVNNYLILGNTPGLRPRAEIEMPKLVLNARELIALLKEEYPE
jgi:hypothetical protein